LGLDAGKVELYKMDVASGNYLFHDSLLVNAAFNFGGVDQGVYLVKASPAITSSSYLTYLPTYYGNTPYWILADNILPCQATAGLGIHLVPVQGTLAGPGSIGGIISTLLKQSNSGIPAAGYEILLTNPADEVLAVCYSNSNGAYLFNNLALGDYKIRVERTGIPSYPVFISLSSGAPAQNNVNFNITPGGIVTGLMKPLSDLTFRLGFVFPNPATNMISMEVTAKNKTNFMTEVYNIHGQIVISQHELIESGNHVIRINTENLKAGNYFLSVIPENGIAIRRKVSICR
jgi:hypothetical protein